MADRYLLESGAPDGYLLEDGSGVLLLDVLEPTSRRFNGTSDYLRHAAAVDSASPFTVAGWAYVDSGSSGVRTIYAMGRLADDHAWWVQVNASGKLICTQNGSWGGADPTAVSVASVPTDTWFHWAAVFTSDSSRAIFLSGTKATNVEPVTTSAPNTTGFGATARTTPTLYFDGMIGQAAQWTTALSDGDVGSLAAGAVPNTIAAGNLLAYWPLVGMASPEPDDFAAFDMTVNGATHGESAPPLSVASTILYRSQMPQLLAH